MNSSMFDGPVIAGSTLVRFGVIIPFLILEKE